MALYLFVSRIELRGTQANPEWRTVLNPVRGQMTLASAGNRTEPLGDRRLQLSLADRSAVCALGPGKVFALWDPESDYSETSRPGRLRIHSRGGEEYLVYGDNFKLTLVGNYIGDLTIGELLVGFVALLDEDNLKQNFAISLLGDRTASVDDVFPAFRERLRAVVPRLYRQAARDRAAQADEQADTAVADRIKALQGDNAIDYSRISCPNRELVFEILDKLAVGETEIHFEVNGIHGGFTATRNKELILSHGSGRLSEDRVEHDLVPCYNSDGFIISIPMYDTDMGLFKTIGCGLLRSARGVTTTT